MKGDVYKSQSSIYFLQATLDTFFVEFSGHNTQDDRHGKQE